MLDLEPIKARRAIGQPPLWPQLDALIAEVERLQRVAQAAIAWRHSTTPTEESALVGAVDALEEGVA